MFWPRRLAPVFNDSVSKWFADASTYSLRFLGRNVQPEEVSALARLDGRHLQLPWN